MLPYFFAGLGFALTFVSAANGTNQTQVVKLAAPDGSIKANFLSYGAHTTNVWVKDKNGKFRDIFLGYDDVNEYEAQKYGRTYFGPIVGRYANRIKNGTFSIPISSDVTKTNFTVYHIPENENGLDTLHGGYDGYDQRHWEVLSYLSNSVTFGLKDSNGTEGFPGTVFTQVTYTLLPEATYHISITAQATEKTPILLSAHQFWNLEAYEETQDLDGHIAQIKASQVIATDPILIPNGNLLNVSGTPLDFTNPKSLGAGINATAGLGYCGNGCVGYDNCWIYDNNKGLEPVVSIYSTNSGIKLDITTNQPALQLYSCDGIYNATLPIPRKASQGGPSQYYDNHSCFVLEQEGWIDAINNPEWDVDQIYSPARPYVWESKYVFSTVQ